MFAHRAMYCTNIFALGCKDKGFVFRDGFPDNGSYAMEEILNKYGVDMFIGGHEVCHLLIPGFSLPSSFSMFMNDSGLSTNLRYINCF